MITYKKSWDQLLDNVKTSCSNALTLQTQDIMKSFSKISTTVNDSIVELLNKTSKNLANIAINCYSYSPELFNDEDIIEQSSICGTSDFYKSNRQNKINNESLPLAA